jgi:hypothetical protein
MYLDKAISFSPYIGKEGYTSLLQKVWQLRTACNFSSLGVFMLQ